MILFSEIYRRSDNRTNEGKHVAFHNLLHSWPLLNYFVSSLEDKPSEGMEEKDKAFSHERWKRRSATVGATVSVADDVWDFFACFHTVQCLTRSWRSALRHDLQVGQRLNLHRWYFAMFSMSESHGTCDFPAMHSQAMRSSRNLIVYYVSVQLHSCCC